MENNLFQKCDGYFQSDRVEMLKYLPKGIRRTLEFGCGFGGFSSLIKKTYNAEVWAVELDEKASLEASKKLNRVINKDADASLSDVPDHYFDCIIFLDVLEHLVDPYTLLKKIKSKICGNGIVLASIPNIRYYRAFVSYALKGEWPYKEHGIFDKTHLRFFTYKSIIKMFDDTGYEILLIEGIHRTSSRTYKLLNCLLFNSLRDVGYKHFAVVAKPK